MPKKKKRTEEKKPAEKVSDPIIPGPVDPEPPAEEKPTEPEVVEQKPDAPEVDVLKEACNVIDHLVLSLQGRIDHSTARRLAREFLEANRPN